MKTTQKQFSIFKDAATQFIDLFGLKSWDVYINLAPCETPSSIAECSWDPENRCASITLNDKYDIKLYKLTDEYLRRYAKHEVIHILLSPIHDELRKAMVHEKIILTLIHSLSAVIENIAFGE